MVEDLRYMSSSHKRVLCSVNPFGFVVNTILGGSPRNIILTFEFHLEVSGVESGLIQGSFRKLMDAIVVGVFAKLAGNMFGRPEADL